MKRKAKARKAAIEKNRSVKIPEAMKPLITQTFQIYQDKLQMVKTEFDTCVEGVMQMCKLPLGKYDINMDTGFFVPKGDGK